MARITVGQQYSTHFAGIVELFRDGALSKDVNIRRVEDGLIETETNTFVLSGATSLETTSAQRFDNRGASWFGVFRGEQVDDSNSAWIELIETVAKDYRKHNSFIEFKQKKKPKQKGEEQKLVTKFFDCVLSKIYPGCTLSDAVGMENVDIFGLSMKLEVGNGVGQSEPILCKMYFRKIKDDFVPLSKGQAFEIEDFINNATADSDDNKSLELDSDYGEMISSVFAALTECIEDKAGTEDNDFSDYVVFSGEDKDSVILAEANDVVKKDTDFNKVKFMLKILGNSAEKQLDCSKVDILSISHVEWENSVFKVKQGDKDVLYITVGINNSIDVRCVNCGGRGSILVESNRIKSNEEEQDDWILEPNKDDFGVSDSITDIINYSEFKNHLFEVDCSQGTMDSCKRTVCSSQVFEVTEGVLKCANCRHPEVVYVDIFDQQSTPKSTHALEFAVDKLAFVDKDSDDLFKCPCCHNSYTQATEQRSSGLCEHCATVDDSVEGKNKYKLYHKMLSPTTRLFHLFKKKSCKEYRGKIIFALGKDRYIFDRLSAREHGLVKGPSKYRRR